MYNISAWSCRVGHSFSCSARDWQSTLPCLSLGKCRSESGSCKTHTISAWFQCFNLPSLMKHAITKSKKRGQRFGLLQGRLTGKLKIYILVPICIKHKVPFKQLVKTNPTNLNPTWLCVNQIQWLPVFFQDISRRQIHWNFYIKNKKRKYNKYRKHYQAESIILKINTTVL